MSEELNEFFEDVENTDEAAEDMEKIGNVKISVDVVATIAAVATTACAGVYDMSGSFAGDIAEKLGAKKNPNKGVKVEITENTTVVDLFIVVKYGVRIPELAWEIQESVKNNIESMTGLDVKKVNIHIEGVNFDEEVQKSDAQVKETVTSKAPEIEEVKEETEE